MRENNKWYMLLPYIRAKQFAKNPVSIMFTANNLFLEHYLCPSL